ncbi:MAG: DotU family type IV/VI secretion system protein [Candidatus Adiutrix sp.]|jgi:hypothetical protein|nr:DotU family type IV/VI secretion system protein [Candidatus Adiutrix sp.]
MIFKSHQTRLDQYLPAMLLAAEIKNGYGGPMEAGEMAGRLASLLTKGSSAPAPGEDGQPAAWTRRGPHGPILDDAFFAACAYIDEALMNSNWTNKGQWLRHSLIRRYFNTLLAGTEFFDRLTHLLNFGRSGGLAAEAPDIDPAATFDHQAGLPEPRAYQAGASLKKRASNFIAGQARRLKDELKEVVEPFIPRNFEPGGAPADEPAPVRRRFDPWRESIEVFAAALSLGFNGRHYGPDGLEHLESIKRHVAAALGPPLAAEAGRLPDLTALALSRPKSRTGGRILSGLLYALPLVLTLLFMVSHRSALARFTLDWARALGVLP